MNKVMQTDKHSTYAICSIYFRDVVPGGAMAPLADQLTLSQPGGGADYAHQIIMAPPDYQTFLRPCILKQKTSLLSVVPSNDRLTVVQLKNQAFC